MYSSIFANKDTTITNVTINNNSKTGSNSGLSEILELYVLTSSLSSRGKSRILINFDLTSHSQSIAAGKVPTSSVEYRLKLKNSVHSQKLPSSYDLEVLPLSKSFDEGRGLSMYDEGLKDSGFANWTNSTRTTLWDLTGSDFITSVTGSQHFDFGDEDLDVDISNIVYAFLTGNVENRGLLLRFTETLESSSSDLFVKKFYSRHSIRPERRPRIEALWEDHLQDDRKNIFYNVSSSLYYYNFINGRSKNVSEPVFVDVIDVSSSVVQTLTASRKDTGIYEASGVLVSHDPTTTKYKDVWFNSSEQLFTGSFTPTFVTGSTFFNFDEIDVLIPNLKTVYNSENEITLRVVAKEKDYRPAIRVSGTANVIDGLYLQESFFSIENAETKEVIIPFSTGSNKFSKLSYDEKGNYFKLNLSSLSAEALYKIKIRAEYNDQVFVFNNERWIFKIEK